jgi:ketosteroid isomerase-like protein
MILSKAGGLERLKRILWGALIVIALLVTACGSPEIPTVPGGLPSPRPRGTDTPTPASDEEAVYQLLNAEAEGVVSQDIDRLMEIWAEDGVVTDANHTPDNLADDRVWSGIAAIRERYVDEIFPSAPGSVTHPDVELSVEGNSATAISTTTIGIDHAPSGDRWTFEKRDGRWVITSLTFNLEAQ